MALRRLRSCGLVILREMPPPRAGVGHQHGVAAGQRQVGGERRALVAALLLDDLHQDDLAALDDFLDLVGAQAAARALRAAPPAHPREPTCSTRSTSTGRGVGLDLIGCRSSSTCAAAVGRRVAVGRMSSLRGDRRSRPRARRLAIGCGRSGRRWLGERAMLCGGAVLVAMIVRSTVAIVGGRRSCLVAVSGGDRRARRRLEGLALVVRLRRQAPTHRAPAGAAPRRGRRPRPLPRLRRRPPRRAAPAGRRPGSGSSRDGFR